MELKAWRKSPFTPACLLKKNSSVFDRMAATELFIRLNKMFLKKIC